MVYRFTPMPARSRVFIYPPSKLGPLGAGDKSATETSLHVTCIRAPPRRLPAFPGMHAALASTRGGAPALLRQNAGLDHAGRPVRAASGNRTRRAA